MDANLVCLSIYFAGYLFTFICYLARANDGRDASFVALFWPIVLVLESLCLITRRFKQQ